MAEPIFLTSLSPTRGERDVSVFRDVIFSIESTVNDLKIETLVFKINDYQLRPTAYYDGSRKKINVIFHAVDLIKYNTVRYHQAEVRYGKPTDRLSNFLYDHAYKVQVEIQDDQPFLYIFYDFYTFYTEKGVEYNASPRLKLLIPNCLQELGNYFPQWSKARMDKFSVFQQFSFPIANNLEKMDLHVGKATHDNYLNSADKNELSTLYSVYLDVQYNFNTVTLEGGKILSVPPDVVAYIEHHKFEILPEKSNSIDEFYYNKIPKSITAEKSELDELIIATGNVDTSLTNLDKRLPLASGFYLNITGSGSFSTLNTEQGYLKILTCRITGVSAVKIPQTEDIAIGGPDYYRSLKRWNKIDTITFFNVYDNLIATYSISFFKIGETHLPNIYRFINTNREIRESIWKLGYAECYGCTLQLFATAGDGLQVLMNQMRKDLVEEYELLDVDNETNLNLIDIEVDKFANYIYGIDDNYLYIFYRKIFYPDCVKNIPSGAGDAQMVIVMDEEPGVRELGGKAYSFYGQQIVLNKRIVRARCRIMFPDKKIYYIKPDGTFILSDQKNEATVLVKDNTTLAKTSVYEIVLPDAGDYVLLLDALTHDGAISTDSRIIRVPFLPAIAKYKLERIKRDKKLVAIFMDFDSVLKIIDEENTVYSLSFNKENMLVDYTNKKLFFNEFYDRVIVSEQ